MIPVLKVLLIIFAVLAVMAFLEWCAISLFTNKKNRPKFGLKYIVMYALGLPIIMFLSFFEIWQVLLAVIVIFLAIISYLMLRTEIKKRK